MLLSLNLWHIAAAGVGVLLASRAIEVWKIRRRFASAGFEPRLYLLSPLSILATSLQTFTSFSPLKQCTWKRRNEYYGKEDIIIAIPFWGEVQIWIRSQELAKLTLNQYLEFEKTPIAQRFINFLGDNVIAASSEEWKRHRRITAPAFNATTYQNVWNQTIHVYQDLVTSKGWQLGGKVTIDDGAGITHKLAMFVVVSCSFGIDMSWSDPEFDELGNWTPKRVLSQVSENVMMRALLTNTLLDLLPFKAVRAAKVAFDKFGPFAKELVGNKERELRQDTSHLAESRAAKDLLGAMVQAKQEAGKFYLTSDELVSNCFIFLLAGHETTAQVLFVTLVLLGIYPEVQEETYQNIIRLVGDRELSFDDYDSLGHVLACFLEGGRMYPPVFAPTRQPVEDCQVPFTTADGVTKYLPLQKGDCLFYDMFGIGYNAHTYPDPEEFRPSRWTQKMTSEHLMFSHGPRQCLGKKFSTTEATAFLSAFIRDWKIEVDILPGETPLMSRERLLDPSYSFTLQFPKTPVKLTRRKTAPRM